MPVLKLRTATCGRELYRVGNRVTQVVALPHDFERSGVAPELSHYLRRVDRIVRVPVRQKRKPKREVMSDEAWRDRDSHLTGEACVGRDRDAAKAIGEARPADDGHVGTIRPPVVVIATAPISDHPCS